MNQRARTPRSGAADAFLFFFRRFVGAQQTRPAGLERQLHMHVSLGQLTASLQDLGVNPMALEQSLPHAELLKSRDGELELAISGLVVATPVRDPAEPRMRFGNTGFLTQALRQLQRMLGVVKGLLVAALLERQLTQA